MAKYYVQCGEYHKFVIEADNEEQAREYFINASDDVSLGFREEDITSIVLLEA